MTVVSGYAETLTRSLSGDELDYARSLLSAANTVVELSEKAQLLERITRTDGNPAVDATAATRAAVRSVRYQYPDVVTALTAPEQAMVRAHPQLETAIVNVVENAAKHNREASPEVQVCIDEAVETVDVRVADDGPGIPEQERAVVLGEREITQLDHASGLGLWLVDHIVSASGGQVSFARSDLGGSEVTLHLPVASE
jgi:signal transduction histidine kinase